MFVVVYNEWKSPMAYPMVYGPFSTQEEAETFCLNKAKKLSPELDNAEFTKELNEPGFPVYQFNDPSRTYLMIAAPWVEEL